MSETPPPAGPTPGPTAGSPAPLEALKPAIQYEDFARLDLRIGTVLRCEPHPNADKLLLLQVDLGGETRQIVAGIRAHYAPESLLGRQVVIVANLAPRTMRGFESQGMLLAATSPDRASVIFIAPERALAAGSTVS